MRLKKFFSYWGPVFIWALVIFFFSSLPTLPSPKIIWWDFILKKSAHIIEYAIFYFLIFRAVNRIKIEAPRPNRPRILPVINHPFSDFKAEILPKRKSQDSWITLFSRGLIALGFSRRRIKNLTPSLKRNYLIPLLIGFLYSITDEIHQSFVPGRTCRATDVGFDLLGMLISSWQIPIRFRLGHSDPGSVTS